MPTRHQRYQKALDDLADAFDRLKWNPTDPSAIAFWTSAQKEYTEAWEDLAETEQRLEALESLNKRNQS